MGQVNVNPPRGDGEGAAAAGMGAGMMMALTIGVILLLILAFFVLRPLFFGGTPDVNVNVRSSDVMGLLHLVL